MSSQTINRSETNGRIDSERPNRCLECGAGLHVECGETYCPSCGTVVAEDHIDHGPGAHELAVCAEETGIANGKKPSGVAAACVYHAAAEVGYPVTRGTTLTQADLAEVAGVTAVTLRNCWRALTDACCP